MPCKCPDCYGLAEHMLERTGKDYGLPRARGHVPLTVLVGESACDGSMTCECPEHVKERVQAAERRRAGRVCLPWELDAA